MYNIGFIVILYQKIKNSIFLKQKIISLKSNQYKYIKILDGNLIWKTLKFYILFISKKIN